MRVWVLTALIGCEFSASTSKIGPSDTGSVSGSGGGDSDTDDGDTGADGGDDPDTGVTDADEDGYTPQNGDCDDDDASVYPGAVDDCDGIDSDCDGVVDDESVVDDAYEPNDAVDYDLGTLEGDDAHEVQAFLHDSSDEDRFVFDFTDGLIDFFTLRVILTSSASDVFYQMMVERIDTDEVVFNEFSDASGSLTFEEGDTLASDDGGQYRVTIVSDGSATCLNDYTLRVELDEFL